MRSHPGLRTVKDLSRTSADSRFDKTFSIGHPYPRKGLAVESCQRVDSELLVISENMESIRDERNTLFHENGPVELFQYEESGETETMALERKGNQAIEVGVIGRWIIVCDHRRSHG